MELWIMCLRRKFRTRVHALMTPQLVRWCSSPCTPEDHRRNSQVSIFTKEGVHSINLDNGFINFYSGIGRLDLHQNEDNSRDSVEQGLLVIFVTIGGISNFVFGGTSNKKYDSKIQPRLQWRSHISTPHRTDVDRGKRHVYA